MEINMSQSCNVANLNNFCLKCYYVAVFEHCFCHGGCLRLDCFKASESELDQNIVKISALSYNFSQMFNSGGVGATQVAQNIFDSFGEIC